jgi:hypothetical protein
VVTLARSVIATVVSQQDFFDTICIACHASSTD